MGRLVTMAGKQPHGAENADERVDATLDEDVTPDAAQSEQVKGGGDRGVAGSASDGGWDGGDW
jgi:hypothetical protein